MFQERFQFKTHKRARKQTNEQTTQFKTHWTLWLTLEGMRGGGQGSF